ncbi:hypothetical protein ABMA28_002045 [Loxostege sticticalis]|uniref:A kinase anchor protein 200 n=1 Tax=Loxostege sticticalis TaxID=481309 RepID=A0ABD0SZQ9_LOXSC
MGAKQSKRSVDISGKEAEGAGEVAAAGAGGEGRVEPLADADALKPQLNGDAHIHEQTDKEKQLDSGTPENEKDATTEKEGKQEDSEKDKAETPVTNGDGEEQKTENGDSAPTPEDGKKPKKEKVKKKWSLRSISFSRKDKPKQEKKQKEEEPKTNGEPEKVPEEAAEVVPESAATEVAEAKSENETKDEKTPETPVTEPITNGSNTPESPKVEIPVAEETAPVASPESDKTDTEPQPEPEQLPVNGLSLQETTTDAPEVPKVEESQPVETPAESTETVPAVEIPVQKEVCVEQMPLIESTPPPLPANPPPSSVASFAATTMAPDLTDASLANTTETAKCTLPTVLDTKTDTPNENSTEIQADLTNSVSSSEVPSSLNKSIDPALEIVKQSENIPTETAVKVEDAIASVPPPIEEVSSSLTKMNNECDVVPEQQSEIASNETADQHVNVDEIVENSEIQQNVAETVTTEIDSAHKAQDSEVQDDAGSPVPPVSESPVGTPEAVSITEPSTVEDLPPPPSPTDENMIVKLDHAEEQIDPPAPEMTSDSQEIVVNGNDSNSDVTQTNGIVDEPHNGSEETENENIKNKLKDSLGNMIESTECNGNTESPSTESPPPPCAAEEASAVADDEAALPAPPAELCAAPPAAPQESLPVSDKIADLIPEVPVVPELKAETEVVAQQ